MLMLHRYYDRKEVGISASYQKSNQGEPMIQLGRNFATPLTLGDHLIKTPTHLAAVLSASTDIERKAASSSQKIPEGVEATEYAVNAAIFSAFFFFRDYRELVRSSLEVEYKNERLKQSFISALAMVDLALARGSFQLELDGQIHVIANVTTEAAYLRAEINKAVELLKPPAKTEEARKVLTLALAFQKA